jgi:hypothetical protein
MKTSVFSLVKAAVIASVLGILALGSSNSFASIMMHKVDFNGISGLVAPSYPAFGTSVNVTYDKFGGGKSVLKATYDSCVNFSVLSFSNPVFKVKKTSYTLTSNFIHNKFESGTLTISGQIEGLGITTTQTLLTANLTKFAIGDRGKTYGWNTSNIVCNPLINAYEQCTKAEVVYLGLEDAHKTLGGEWRTKATALTSVPIPAAAWMFGSGVMGLAAVARRKKKTSLV